MKNLLTTLKSASKRLSVLAALVIAGGGATVVFAAGGPERTTFTMEHPAPYVTFNSITNNPYYNDERNFVMIKDATSGQTMSDQTTLVDGHEYVVQIYIHNDASEVLNESGVGVARDTTVRAAIPSSVSSTSTIKASIYASNAIPTEVWDDVNLTSNGSFDIQYVSGSATLDTQYQSVTLGDAIATTGVKVGHADLSGKWQGCINSAGVVKFKIRVKAKVVDNDIKVCRLSDKKYPVTIKESEFDSTKYSKNPDDCKVLPATDKDITVCRLSDKAYPVTIKESAFDSTKYSKNPEDCKVSVCRLSDKTVVKIYESEFDSAKYSRDTANCKPATPVTTTPTPAAPAAIASTGPEMVLGGLFGSSALGLGISSFVRSRRALRTALNN